MAPLIKRLSACSWVNSVLPVLPHVEQSWVADAITRFRPLKAVARDFSGIKGYLIDGTPADCASLAINNLNQGIRPELLISGVNMGTNAGLSFFLCSGTVGAVTQAYLNGVRGVALSCALPSQVYQLWSAHDFEGLKRFEADFERVAEVGVSVVRALFTNAALWKSADYFTVNLPWGVSKQTKLTLTALTKAPYKPLFEPQGELEFKHKFGGFAERLATKSSFPLDFDVLERGEISVTPIVYNLEAALSKEIAAGFGEQKLE